MKGRPTVTVTFGDMAESHVGMQKIGSSVTRGLSVQDLHAFHGELRAKGGLCELWQLDSPTSVVATEAAVLVVRGGVETLLGRRSDELERELVQLQWDRKARMYGRVVEKVARYNLCFAESEQEPDYEAGRGRVVAYNQVPVLKELRCAVQTLLTQLGHPCTDLAGEGNLYFDVNSCGIGYHGDAERKVVVAVRLGAAMKLQYCWFQHSKSLGPPSLTLLVNSSGGTEGHERVQGGAFMLNHGDMYFMSEKATGNDWRQKNIATLRHAAGAEKYLMVKRPVKGKGEKGKRQAKLKLKRGHGTEQDQGTDQKARKREKRLSSGQQGTEECLKVTADGEMRRAKEERKVATIVERGGGRWPSIAPQARFGESF